MKYLFTGGGTGGHIYPALATINFIKNEDPEAEFMYVGARNGLEQTIVPKADIPFHALTVTGFKRKLSLDNVKTVMRFLKAVRISKSLLRSFQPDVVIGTGGYVAGPVVYAAAKMRIPTIIHEQNSVTGLTNRFLSRYTDKIAVAMEAAMGQFPEEKAVLVGNPRATEVLGGNSADFIQETGLELNEKLVVILAGSRGAAPVNKAVLEMADSKLPDDCRILYITGDIHYEKIKEELQGKPGRKQMIVKPFVYNMPDVLKTAHVMISRAGATTLAEMTALGIPGVLIPSPYVTNNHQEKNARALEKTGAAIVITEAELTGEKLLHSLEDLLQDDNWKKMRKHAKEAGIPDAADRMYSLIRQLTGED